MVSKRWPHRPTSDQRRRLDRFVPFVEILPELGTVIAINYRGVLNTVRAVLPRMIERGDGRIVSVASDAAHVGSPLESVDAGAKAGRHRVLQELRP